MKKIENGLDVTNEEFNEIYLKLKIESEERERLFDKQNESYFKSLKDSMLFLKDTSKVKKQIEDQIKLAEELLKNSNGPADESETASRLDPKY